MPLTTHRRWEGLDTPREADEMIAEQIERGVALGRSRHEVTRDLWFQARSLLLDTPRRAEIFPERPMLMRAYRAARLAHFATLGGPR